MLENDHSLISETYAKDIFKSLRQNQRLGGGAVVFLRLIPDFERFQFTESPRLTCIYSSAPELRGNRPLPSCVVYCGHMLIKDF